MIEAIQEVVEEFPGWGFPKSVQDTQAAGARLEPQAGTSSLLPITAE